VTDTKENRRARSLKFGHRKYYHATPEAVGQLKTRRAEESESYRIWRQAAARR
jgi:hypothetical protein